MLTKWLSALLRIALRPAVLLFLFLLTASAPPLAVLYVVGPILTNGRLTALSIRLQLHGSAVGNEVLDLPMDDRDGHPHLSDLKISGAESFRLDGNELHLQFRPGTNLSIHYLLLPGSQADPSTQSKAPIIRPEWFAVHGESALMVPQGRENEAAGLRYVSVPAGWMMTSNLPATSTSVAGIRETMLIGGAHYREISRVVLGAKVRLAYPPEFTTSAPRALEEIAQIDTVERGFWRANGEPFFVAVVPLADDVEYEGRGLDGGFVLFLGVHAPQEAWLHLLAHEHMHSWISRRIGGFPKSGGDLEAWLNEGFTEAFTARVLLQSGLWSVTQFVADQNAALVRYGTSPVKTEPNTRIGADRHRDWDVNKLPYDRGRLLALLWDGAIRRRTAGRLGLEDVMRAQADRVARDGPKLSNVSADVLFPVIVREMTGIDLAPDISRYVDRGAEVVLPSDAFGPCADVIRVKQPVFDRGFDLEETLKAHGRVVGLVPGGPAERAGLRLGDKITVDETPSHDSQAVLTYVVSEPVGATHVVRYKPEGEGRVTFQQVRLKPRTWQQSAGCPQRLARP